MRRLILSLSVLILGCGIAAAQMTLPQGGTRSVATKVETPKPKPAKKKAPPAPKLPPAHQVFGSVEAPAPLEARAIGGYSKGCLSGGISLPINGPDWQVMRLSRNRNWGSPQLVDFLERLASDAHALDGWPGLLVGDLSQPRGGPMLTGHTSHQIGLDADIWLTPMPPGRTLSLEEREDLEAVSMLKDPFSVDPSIFTDAQVKLIRRAALYRQVGRIFVHPAIKRALCKRASSVGDNTSWLGKVRPWWNHHYHFHVRLSCPPGMTGCVDQKPVTGDLGCGEELDNWDKMLKKSAIWMAEQNVPPPPTPGTKPAKISKKKKVALRDLPNDCKTVLTAGGVKPLSVDDELPPGAMKAAASKEAGPGVPILTQAQLKIVRNGGKLSMPMPDRNPVR